MKKNKTQKLARRSNESNNVAHEKELVKTIKHKNNQTISLRFSMFAKRVSDIAGNAYTFVCALIIVLIWGISGQYFNFSDTWQLVINTGTTIVTFLVVFLIQNTQNRDTEILNLKIDELIKAKKTASNDVINLNDLSDMELKELEQAYIKLKGKKTGL